MDTIGEVAVRIGGALLRIIAEALREIIFEPVFRLIGRAYNYAFQQIRRLVPSDFLATPITILLLLAVGAGVTAAVTRARFLKCESLVDSLGW
jgi:hypothetical protein